MQLSEPLHAWKFSIRGKYRDFATAVGDQRPFIDPLFYIVLLDFQY